MKTILLTGGLGFIGSHTAVELLEAGYDVVIADDLSNSEVAVLSKIEEITGKSPTFYEVDVADYEQFQKVFAKHKFTAVIHFAGYKAVGESVQFPLKYYQNNLASTINVAKLCKEYGVSKIIFSSSATVYGEQTSPMSEDMPLLPTTNPYGESKAVSERILSDFASANPECEVVLLRYFNPVGAHSSGLIGEKPSGVPNNLMPYIWQVALGWRDKLSVFGDDYPTADGTGVRDYIHVVDLARGHLSALQVLGSGVHLFNLGTGAGYSVLQMVKSFQEVTGVSVPYQIVPRRPGDGAVCYAEAGKAKKVLHWQAKKSLQDICQDTWRFARNFLKQGD